MATIKSTGNGYADRHGEDMTRQCACTESLEEKKVQR